MPKKIIITVSNDVQYDQRIYRIAQCLHSAGYQITILGRKMQTTHDFSILPYKVVLFDIPFSKGFMMFALLNIRFFLYLLFHPADILCAVDLDTILPSIFIKKIKKITLIYDAHELYPESPEIVSRPRMKRFWLKIEKYAFQNIDYCYTVSQGIADFFLKKYKYPCSVIRNMPELNTLPLAHDTSTPSYLLYQGALNMGRGLEKLIEAMQYIHNIPLYIAGSGDIEDDLKELASLLKLEKRIHFMGKLTPDELRQVTLGAHIGFNLLEDIGLSYYYSLANKFFDYVQCRVPQLCIDFPEYRHLNNEYEVAILASNIDPKNIAENIQNLLDDKEYFKKLQINCKRAAEVWNWEKESLKLIAIYASLS